MWARATISDRDTTSSQVTMTRPAALAISTSGPEVPSHWAFPSASARRAWTMATSGWMARMAVSSSPVKGHETVR